MKANFTPPLLTYCIHKNLNLVSGMADSDMGSTKPFAELKNVHPCIAKLIQEDTRIGIEESCASKKMTSSLSLSSFSYLGGKLISSVKANSWIRRITEEDSRIGKEYLYTPNKKIKSEFRSSWPLPPLQGDAGFDVKSRLHSSVLSCSVSNSSVVEGQNQALPSMVLGQLVPKSSFMERDENLNPILYFHTSSTDGDLDLQESYSLSMIEPGRKNFSCDLNPGFEKSFSCLCCEDIEMKKQ